MNAMRLCALRYAQEGGSMEQERKIVDGFRFLPPGLKAWIRTFIPEEDFKGYIPWTPLSKPLSQTTFSLVTSAGISLKSDPPFDMEREKRESVWGDRSFRAIPRQTTEKEIDVNHLHINTGYIKQDINVILPLARMAEFEAEGIIGRLAPNAYSFYGFQWQSTDFLKEAIEPISKRDEGRRSGGCSSHTGLTLLLPVRWTGCPISGGSRFLHRCDYPDLRISPGCRYSPICGH